MRPCLAFLVARAAGASLLFTLLLPPPHLASAGEANPANNAPSAHSVPREAPALRRGAPPLDESDEIAVLEAIRVALSEVSDGSTYVWHRWHGRLSGLVQPTASFKDVTGRVCRHIVLILSSAARTGKIEGIACRMDDGRWQLDG